MLSILAVTCLSYKESVLKHHMSGARASDLFSVIVMDSDSQEEHILEGFDSVVDATGTFGNGNFFGAGGAPALGELSLLRTKHPGLRKDIPDAVGVDKEAYVGKRVCVVGSGYSAITSVSKLLAMSKAESESGSGGRVTHIDWVSRHGTTPYERMASNQFIS